MSSSLVSQKCSFLCQRQFRVCLQRVSSGTGKLRKRISPQFLRSQVLLDVLRTAVEDPKEGFLVERRDLCLDGLHIRHLVALREADVGNRGSGRRVIEQRVDLG